MLYLKRELLLKFEEISICGGQRNTETSAEEYSTHDWTVWVTSSISTSHELLMKNNTCFYGVTLTFLVILMMIVLFYKEMSEFEFSTYLPDYCVLKVGIFLNLLVCFLLENDSKQANINTSDLGSIILL